ncbi:hypothetical protein PIB30_024566 [Stylosanthes scabra]|uniref:Uncharacterized protein n=1 Tax=Stylosanthes scabra TaxID=79078 RepID=A0ABU6TA21_9FABA|nr:hypothetical protein [Stylosanthes scabra]
MAASFEAMANLYIHNQTINLVIISSPSLPHNSNNNSSVNMIHKIYACVFPSLLTLLQIQTSADSSKSPFQVHHPLITGASVLGIFSYYLAFLASLRFSRYATQLSMAMAVFGSFSMAWLVALLVPESWWPLSYVFNVILAFLELHQVLMAIYERFVKRLILMMVMSKIRRSRSSSSSWINNSERHILPLTYTDLN